LNGYTIITDTGCDITGTQLAQWNIKCVDLTFHFEKDTREYRNGDITPSEFYQNMRNGKCAKTSAANLECIRAVFEPELLAGRDILYLAFSASLSNTYSIAGMAAKELMKKYPQRRILIMDTCCASGGLGLLLYLCAQRRDSGASLTELAEFAAEKAPSISHWFTVDDLVYLKRGGRVSAATALAGSILRIKPVMHMDDAGHLTNVRKVRGRKQAIAAIAEQYLATASQQDGVYFISHGDCMADAVALEDMIYAKVGQKAGKITDIGSVIGAHSGPGTLALFFLGQCR